MLLRDRIFSEPASFLTGCLAWVPLAIWVLCLVRWMVGGEIDVIFGFLGIGMAVGIGYLAINPPSPQYSIIIFIIIAATLVMFPFVSKAVAFRSLRAIDVEDVARAYEAIRARPDNVSAKFRIARLIYEMGYPGHALRIAEACIAQVPQAFFLEEHRIVNRWRMTPTPHSAFNPLSCIECQHPNPPGNVHCAACGAPFLLDRLRGKILPSVLGKRLMAAWIVMVAIMAGLPLVGSIGGPIAFIGIVALLVLAFGVLAIAFRDPDPGVSA